MYKKLFLATSVAAVMLALAFLSACGQPAAPGPEAPAGQEAPAAPAPPPAPAPSPPPAGEVVIGEAAVIGVVAERLAEGTVLTESPWFAGRGYPPVAERMPRHPGVWNNADETHLNFQRGRFSGYPLRTVRMGVGIWDALLWTGNYSSMVISPNRLGAEFLPNVIDSFDISDDLMTFTFTLREGMRWSDGHPVTTQDVYFAYNYFQLDERIHPTTGTWWRAGGDPRGEVARQEIVDRYTWRMHYSEPTGGLIAWMAFSSYVNWIQPYHHLRYFHLDHGDEDVIREKVLSHGWLFPEEWQVFFQYHRQNEWYSGRTSRLYPHGPNAGPGGTPGGTPSIAPWLHSVNGDVRIFHRNPFYWRVDRYGQQLPYIDVIESYFVTDLSAAQIRIMAGDIDHSYEYIPLTAVALFAEHAEAANLRLLTNTTFHRTDVDIFFGQTHECPRWRSVAQDVRFRRAFSRAICREDMLETIYFGFATISNYQDPTHDWDEARALLYDMGMRPAADGFLSPDGDPFIIDFFYSDGVNRGPKAVLLNEILREMGFNVNFRMVEGALLTQMFEANEVQIGVHFQHGPVKPMFDDWAWNRSWRLWHQYWTTVGEVGERPPPHVLEFYDTVFRQIRQNHPRYIPAARERLREIQREYYLHLIPMIDVVQVVTINKDLRNVPEVGFFMLGCFGMDAWWFDR